MAEDELPKPRRPHRRTRNLPEPNVSLTHSRPCSAHSSRTGKPCTQYAIKGATVCRFHGGSAPQVKAKAEQRLRELIMPMITRQEWLANQNDNLNVAQKAAADILDRAGTGALIQAKVQTAQQRGNSPGSGITVNIGFLGNVPTVEIGSASQTIDVLALPPVDTDPTT